MAADPTLLRGWAHRLKPDEIREVYTWRERHQERYARAHLSHHALLADSTHDRKRVAAERGVQVGGNRVGHPNSHLIGDCRRGCHRGTAADAASLPPSVLSLPAGCLLEPIHAAREARRDHRACSLGSQGESSQIGAERPQLCPLDNIRRSLGRVPSIFPNLTMVARAYFSLLMIAGDASEGVDARGELLEEARGVVRLGQVGLSSLSSAAFD